MCWFYLKKNKQATSKSIKQSDAKLQTMLAKPKTGTKKKENIQTKLCSNFKL